MQLFSTRRYPNYEGWRARPLDPPNVVGTTPPPHTPKSANLGMRFAQTCTYRFTHFVDVDLVELRRKKYAACFPGVFPGFPLPKLRLHSVWHEKCSHSVPNRRAWCQGVADFDQTAKSETHSWGCERHKRITFLFIFV